jgi:hypothetical protein
MAAAAAHRRALMWGGLLLHVLASAATAQADSAAQAEIRAALTQWTKTSTPATSTRCADCSRPT